MWHKADWDKVKENPDSVQMPREDWIHGFDAEVHAAEVFNQTFKKFASGSGTAAEGQSAENGAAASTPSVSVSA